MNEIVNKFLLAGDKFMPEMHLRQSGFTYSACGPFIKNKERIQIQTGDASYIYKNELDKACFQHDIAYGDFKDLKRRTFSIKILRDKAFNITKNPKYYGCQKGLASMIYKFFDKKSEGSGIVNNKDNIPLADELRKPIISKFEKRKVYSLFRDNIWGSDLADMELLSKFNKGFTFLFCIIDIFGKYAWVAPLKEKNGISMVNAFQKILNEFNRKPNKIWVNRGSQFYNDSFKKWLGDNGIEMCSTNNGGKSVIAERFIKTKNKIYKFMTTISKNVYIDKLDNIVKECNNTYHKTIKMKSINIKDNAYINFEKEVKNKDPKFNVGDYLRISKYKNIFAKGYMPNWSEEVFIITKTENTVPWTYVINDLNGQEITGTF